MYASWIASTLLNSFNVIRWFKIIRWQLKTHRRGLKPHSQILCIWLISKVYVNSLENQEEIWNLLNNVFCYWFLVLLLTIFICEQNHMQNSFFLILKSKKPQGKNKSRIRRRNILIIWVQIEDCERKRTDGTESSPFFESNFIKLSILFLSITVCCSSAHWFNFLNKFMQCLMFIYVMVMILSIETQSLECEQIYFMEYVCF